MANQLWSDDRISDEVHELYWADIQLMSASLPAIVKLMKRMRNDMQAEIDRWAVFGTATRELLAESFVYIDELEDAARGDEEMIRRMHE